MSVMGEPQAGLIIKGSREKVPQGAIRVTKSEAERIHWELASSWKPWTDVWSIKISHIILSGATAISSILITNFYRRRLKLGTYGQLTTHIPTVLIPTLLCALTQFKWVTFPIVLQNECPICIQLRSSTIQAFFSIVMPGVLAPLASFGYAYNVGSIKLPEVRLSNTKEYLQIYWKMTAKYQRSYGFILAGNSLLASYFAYKSGSQFYSMHMTVLKERGELEKKVYGKVSDSIKDNIAKAER